MISIKGQPVKQSGGAAWTTLGHLNLSHVTDRFVREYLEVVCATICNERATVTDEPWQVVATLSESPGESEIILKIDTRDAREILNESVSRGSNDD